MSSLRYNVDERGHMRPSPDGEYVAFSQYENLGYSSIRGWALAKSLQAQVDILESMAKRLKLKMMPLSNDDAYPLLASFVADVQGTLIALERHRKS